MKNNQCGGRGNTFGGRVRVRDQKGREAGVVLHTERSEPLAGPDGEPRRTGTPKNNRAIDTAKTTDDTSGTVDDTKTTEPSTSSFPRTIVFPFLQEFLERIPICTVRIYISPEFI